MTQPDGGRTIVSRRALPDRRALIGALLVTIAVVGAFTVASGDATDPRRHRVVTLVDVDPGDTLAADDLGVEPMALSETLDGLTLTDIEQAVGTTALVALHAGQLVLRTGVRSATVDGAPIDESHELTIPVDPARLPPSLSRGDRVAVLATEPGVATRVAVANGLVLRVTTSGDAITRAGTSQLTLSLPTAEATLQATHLSYLDLTVVLTTRAGSEPYPDLWPELPSEAHR